MRSSERKNKILIGIDDSIYSQKASDYVKRVFITEGQNCELILLHVIAKTKSEEEDILRGIHDEGKIRAIEKTLSEIKDDFVNSGISPDAVKIIIDYNKHDTITEGILHYIESGSFCTVVLGRRGISRAEEFLFGSVSQKVLHSAHGCAICVVEPNS